MSDLIVSISGIRGIVGQSLTPAVIESYVCAYAKYCHTHYSSSTIVVGRDGRLHGDVIADLTMSVLRMCGYDVIDIGVVPTPTVQIATQDLGAAGGISISASHNPQEWNGLKFLNPDGTFPIQSQVDEIITYTQDTPSMYQTIDHIGSGSTDSRWLEKHIEKILTIPYLDREKIRSRRLKVVIDAVNASGSIIVPQLCEILGCEVIRLYADGSGIFPHTPEPIPANLTQLCQAVGEHQADLGIAVDPDADRLVLIANDGKPFVEENTIVACIAQVLKKSDSLFPDKAKIATVNLSTTRAAEDIALKYGGKCMRSAIGEINVVSVMQSNQSLIGGEGSGGIILPDVHYGRDSLVGVALVLQEFAEYQGTVAQYRDTLPSYQIVKLKLEHVAQPDLLIEKLKHYYQEQNNIVGLNDSDGLKIDFVDHRVHFRKSNTEPIVRIYAEGGSNIADLAQGYQKLAEAFLFSV